MMESKAEMWSGSPGQSFSSLPFEQSTISSQRCESRIHAVPSWQRNSLAAHPPPPEGGNETGNRGGRSRRTDMGQEVGEQTQTQKQKPKIEECKMKRQHRVSEAKQVS